MKTSWSAAKLAKAVWRGAKHANNLGVLNLGLMRHSGDVYWQGNYAVMFTQNTEPPNLVSETRTIDSLKLVRQGGSKCVSGASLVKKLTLGLYKGWQQSVRSPTFWQNRQQGINLSTGYPKTRK